MVPSPRAQGYAKTRRKWAILGPMATRARADATQRELHYRKRLIEIANQINAAPSIPEILVDLKDEMLDLVVRRAGDDLRPRHEEPGALLALQGGPGGQGDPRPQDLRLDRRLHRPLPQDREHRERLRRRRAREAPREPALRRALGQGLRLQTTQVLSTPILFDKYLLGVLQLVNKRGGGAFSARDEEAAEELARSWASPSTTSTAPPAPTSPPSSAPSWTRASSPRRTSRRRSRPRASTSWTSRRS